MCVCVCVCVCVFVWSCPVMSDASLSFSFVLLCLENRGATFPPFPLPRVHLFVFRLTVGG